MLCYFSFLASALHCWFKRRLAFFVMGSREEDEISLELALGVPIQQRFGAVLHEPLAAKWGTCLQLQNGHIYVNCVGKHQSQGLKLDLPQSLPKGESVVVEQGMDLNLSLSIHVSPPKDVEKVKKPQAALLVMVESSVDNKKSNATLDLSPSDPTISSGSASSSSLIRSSPSSSSSSSSCHHPDLHHKSKIDTSNSNKKKRPLTVSGDEMVTAGCAHCLIYVLMSRGDPKCPRCGTSSLLSLNVPQPSLANDLSDSISNCKRQRTREYLSASQSKDAKPRFLQL